MNILTYLIPVAIAVVFLTTVIVILASLRVVVGTNDVNIVQRGKTTTSYGKGLPAGNVFYKWPAWMPAIGVQVTSLPVSVYSLALKDYAAYDKGRVPFMIDVIGFFRVADPNTAAERIPTFEELKNQMTGILQGAIRSILASSEIEEILEGRSKFGEMFTHAVDDQLKNWGITSVKTIELMDIRDAAGSSVIANIMAKKKSLIEMQSRIEVAGNIQKASIAEVEAKRQVGIAEQEAATQIGQRTAEKDKAVGIAGEQAKQEVLEQARVTAEKNMAVIQVQDVRRAEIDKQVKIVAAEQDREVRVIEADAAKQQNVIVAEGSKAQVVLAAEGQRDGALLHAEGVKAEGEASAKATELMQMAPVTAQISLAKEIGSNEPYQQYLVTLKQIEAGQVIGVAQAKALESADVKIISNAGAPVPALKNVMELFTPQGGMQVASALEAFVETPAGKAVVDGLGLKRTNGAAHA